MNTQTRNRLILVAIALLFFIPLVAAFLAQPELIGSDPEETVNRGDLVQPPVALPLEGFRYLGERDGAALEGRWLLVEPVTGACDARCEGIATDLRQVHIATGRRQDKAAVLLLFRQEPSVSEVAALEAIYPKFILAVDDGGDAAAVLVTANGGAAPASGTTFIRDPEGFLMLRYAPGYDRGDLNTDLTKLLKWSGR
ncbi:MAG: hypothetical protein V2I57_10140 [Xanthomonadales bacterium]|nr:hypothetical protein [Xanthomonadales bacterium]